MSLHLAHTADLDAAALAAARRLLDDAFGSGFTDRDWEHALGGMHALLWEGPDLVAHGAVVQRRLHHGGRALRTGYVEAVAVRPDHRRRGHAGPVMDALERVVRGAFEVGALSASDMGAPLYASRGWLRWEGPTSVLAPSGTERTPGDDGGVYVLPVTAELDLAGDLACDWRDGEVW